MFGCDAHHTVSDTTDNNKHGDELLENILMHNLCLLNQGNEPTLITINKSEVIDISVCNNKCISHIKEHII